MPALRSLAIFIGRLLIAAVFIYDATLIARFPTENLGFMQSFGVPGFLMWPSAVVQFGGGILVVLGFATRLVALGMAAFCLLTALIFHHNFADTAELVQFGKDLGLVGGYLFLSAAGAGDWSVDAGLKTDWWPLRF